MPNWDKDPVRHGRTINEILQVYRKERKIREIYIHTYCILQSVGIEINGGTI